MGEQLANWEVGGPANLRPLGSVEYWLLEQEDIDRENELLSQQED